MYHASKTLGMSDEERTLEEYCFYVTLLITPRAFYFAYGKVSQAVRLFEDLPILQFPLGRNVVLLTKIKQWVLLATPLVFLPLFY